MVKSKKQIKKDNDFFIFVVFSIFTIFFAFCHIGALFYISDVIGEYAEHHELQMRANWWQTIVTLVTIVLLPIYFLLILVYNLIKSIKIILDKERKGQ